MKPDWTVTTDDGVVLGAAVTEPAGEAVGDVLLLHAMMVDARALDRPVGAGLAILRRMGMGARSRRWSWSPSPVRPRCEDESAPRRKGSGGAPGTLGQGMSSGGLGVGAGASAPLSMG